MVRKVLGQCDWAVRVEDGTRSSGDMNVINIQADNPSTITHYILYLEILVASSHALKKACSNTRSLLNFAGT